MPMLEAFLYRGAEMGKDTGIEWADATVNFWVGCHKVSAGCKNCYMFRDRTRFGHDPSIVTRTSQKTFYAPITWQEPKRIFVCSWSDFFIEEADEWRDDAWEVIRQTPRHTYMLLTKRVHNIKERLPDDWGDGYDNVWLGVSVENFENTHRVLELNQISAKLRFISAEPLIGSLGGIDYLLGEDRVHWVIVGGESGPDYRPMSDIWAREILHQCKEKNVAFFMKQMGGWPDKHGKIPEDLQVYEFPNML